MHAGGALATSATSPTTKPKGKRKLPSSFHGSPLWGHATAEKNYWQHNSPATGKYGKSVQPPEESGPSHTPESPESCESEQSIHWGASSCPSYNSDS